MQYRKDRKGNDISVLGFGCMRFKRKGNGIDTEETEKQILRAIELGINYFASSVRSRMVRCSRSEKSRALERAFAC